MTAAGTSRRSPFTEVPGAGCDLAAQSPGVVHQGPPEKQSQWDVCVSLLPLFPYSYLYRENNLF